MRKITVAGISALSIAAGSVAVAAALPTGAVLADDTTTTTTPPASGATGAPGTPGAPARVGRLDKALDALVADGTITKDQADKIKAKLAEAKAAAGQRAPKGPLGKAPFVGGLGATLQDVATYLGTDVASLREQLKTKSLGEIAGDKKAGLVQMLTDKVNARIDEAVTKGKLDATKAATLKADAAARLAKLVDQVGGPNGVGPFGGPGGRPHHGR